MNAPIKHMRRFFSAFLADTRGVMLPYVALMMVVFIGLGALALDGGRYMSMQTQMQAMSDAYALAGARELNQESGAITRATNAINNLVTTNGLTGLGYGGTFSHSVTFYSALNAANTGGGTTTSDDAQAKFVQVSVNPVTISTIMPIPFFKAGGSNSFAAGARAIAGFKDRAVCGISPMFICNPYETSGMSDSQATAALDAALDPNNPGYNAATARRLFRMPVVGNNTSPGHFGWLQTPGNIDGCNPNSTPCLNKLIAYDNNSLRRSCFDGSGVVMATGNKPVPDSFNDRFDIYGANGPSANFTPSINVRKGYIAGGGGNWCNATSGDYLSQQANVITGAPSLAQAVTTATAAVTNKKTFQVASTVGIQPNMSIVQTGGNAVLGVVITASGTTVTTQSNITLTIGENLTFLWLTAPLPIDKQWTGICTGGTCVQGNGDWDCLNYWTINHSTAAGALTNPAPTGCTSSNPTISRAQVYAYENSLATDLSTNAPIIDYSGYPRATVANGETGKPMCAISKGFTPIFDAAYDPRIVHVAVINCLAQTQLGNIGGGNSGPPTPVAGFAKYFLTQPYNSDGQTYLYGEMTGLVSSLDGVRILNQVQLYR